MAANDNNHHPDGILPSDPAPLPQRQSGQRPERPGQWSQFNPYSPGSAHQSYQSSTSQEPNHLPQSLYHPQLLPYPAYPFSYGLPDPTGTAIWSSLQGQVLGPLQAGQLIHTYPLPSTGPSHDYGLYVPSLPHFVGYPPPPAYPYAINATESSYQQPYQQIPMRPLDHPQRPPGSNQLRPMEPTVSLNTASWSQTLPVQPAHPAQPRHAASPSHATPAPYPPVPTHPRAQRSAATSTTSSSVHREGNPSTTRSTSASETPSSGQRGPYGASREGHGVDQRPRLTQPSAYSPAPPALRDHSNTDRRSNRRSYDRISGGYQESQTEADDAAERIRVEERRRHIQRERDRQYSIRDASIPTTMQMYMLKKSLIRLLPSELPKGVEAHCDICDKDYSITDCEPTEDDEVAMQLPCEHIFGEWCVNEWLKTCATQKLKITCPMCRKLLIDPLAGRYADFARHFGSHMPRAELDMEFSRYYARTPGEREELMRRLREDVRLEYARGE